MNDTKSVRYISQWLQPKINREQEIRTELEALMPPNDLMRSAWIGALSWAIGDELMLTSFRHETGNNWRPGKTPIEQMIDKATGIEGEFLLAFGKWFNDRIWGMANDH